MGNKTLIFFRVVLLGAIYHLFRDILQIAGFENIFTQVGHWNHEWCGAYCDYVTLPIDLFLIIASAVIIRRRKFDILGIMVLTALFLGLLMWLWK